MRSCDVAMSIHQKPSTPIRPSSYMRQARPSYPQEFCVPMQEFCGHPQNSVRQSTIEPNTLGTTPAAVQTPRGFDKSPRKPSGPPGQSPTVYLGALLGPIRKERLGKAPKAIGAFFDIAEANSTNGEAWSCPVADSPPDSKGGPWGALTLKRKTRGNMRGIKACSII